MEHEDSEEKEQAMYLGVLNHEIGKTLASWKEHQNFLEDSTKLNALVYIAQEAGRGFVIEISGNATRGGSGQGLNLSPEASKYCKWEANGLLIFTLPDAGERKASHERTLKIKFSESHLSLDSSKDKEAYFRAADVLSVEVK
ncbi:MAG: hypothetical protein NTZ07_02710 [Candidatus Woesebacteria bacterium]|nr:hypothetical protein [Candidatus Woesebacteria bacterium]